MPKSNKYNITLTRTVGAYDQRMGIYSQDGWVARWAAPVAETSPIYATVACWAPTKRAAYNKAQKCAQRWHRAVERDVAAAVAIIEAEGH